MSQPARTMKELLLSIAASDIPVDPYSLADPDLLVDSVSRWAGTLVSLGYAEFVGSYALRITPSGKEVVAYMLALTPKKSPAITPPAPAPTPVPAVARAGRRGGK